MLFLQKTFSLCLLQDTISQGFFNSVNLIVVYPLDGNRPHLLATFENWGWQVAKQLFNFFAVFKPEPLAV